MPKQISDDELITALKATGGHRSEAANLVGISERALYSRLAKIDPGKISERALYSRLAKIDPGKVPDPTPRGTVKGTSTLYNAETGEAVLQWVKTAEDAKEREERCKAAIDGLLTKVPKAKPVSKPKKQLPEELLNLYVLTDYHIGMLSWPEETGAAWDLKIAEDLLVKFFQRAVQSAPDAHTGVLAQLGDFLHYDSMETVTPTNKHILDADGRPQKMVRVALRVLRQVVAMLLKKHEEVHILMAEGNHDPMASVWLREAFAIFYEDEPRVTVELSPDPYYCYEWGEVSLFFHHGHKKRPHNIDEVFVRKFRDVFGRTKYSYGHMGHLHHEKSLETNLMTVEQHRTLAAPDAYAASEGYGSDRSAKVETYHKHYGRAGSVEITPAMLK